MRTPTLAALLAAALLAGCGGGGGSSPAPIGGSAPAPSSAPITPQDVAQSATTSAFSAVDTGEADAGLNNGSIATSSTARSPQSKGFVCHNGRTRVVTVNADGSVTVETIDYYDKACTQVERDAVSTFASSGGTATVNRTITTFSLTHAQLGQRKQSYALTGSTTNGTWTVQSAFYPGTSTTPMSQYSHNATINASSYTATTGRIINNAKPSINAAFGHQGATNATISNDAEGDTVFNGTRNGTLFKGPYGALSISSAPPFTISGGTQLGTSALTGTVEFNTDGVLASVNLTGTLLNGNTLTVTSTTDANGILTVNGTVTNPAGATVATFVTDAHGNGTLTITATGAQVPIVDWHVIWA